MAKFFDATDPNQGWARGDPIPDAKSLGPLAPDAVGLTGANSRSDLFSGSAGINTSAASPAAAANIGQSNGGWGFNPGFSSSDLSYVGTEPASGGNPARVIMDTSGKGSDGASASGWPSLGSIFTGMANGPGGSANSSSGIAGIEKWAESWFIRLTVIVLGFIFIAVGLSMMKQTQAIVAGLPLPKVPVR